MMLPYVGSGDYCYANSLYMSLLGSGANPDHLPSPGFLECLTTMPFGNTYLNAAKLFFFDGLDPHQGVTRAIETLGWTCRVEQGGDEHRALERLRAAIQHGPVLIGPLDMGYLTYNPNYPFLGGTDHFMVVLAVEADHVVVHDPKGFPCATLPLENLLKAWRAERIGYVDETYILRADFRPVETVSRQEMIRRTLPFIRFNVQRDPGGPEVYGGVRALRMLAETLRADVPDHLASHLLYFALPLAVRRNLDAQAFLAEGNKPEAAGLLQQQARLLGQAQYPGVQHEWTSVATLIDQVATLEERLIAVCASW
jgi:PAS domain-containing protein